MTAYLKVSTGGDEKRIACGKLTTIGRDKNNDIVLADMQVSRNHAMVRRLGSSDYYLIDSGSSNGSRVNGRRISTPTLLQDGDRFTIGGTEFLFEQEAKQSVFADSLSYQATVIADSPLIDEITVLVADIRGFTALSEQLPIRTLTRLMNRWFEQVSEVIHNNNGVVDKFIGDCVFARWELGQSRENVISALRTACVVQATTTGLSRHFPELPGPLLMGVGINTGMASLGVGSDNTVLGDAVNTAFRLETASKELGTDIVLSESAYAYLPEHSCRCHAQPLKLKGKRQPVKVVGLDYTVAESLLAEFQLL